MLNLNPAQNTLYAKITLRENCGAKYVAVSADLYQHNLKPLYFETLNPARLTPAAVNSVLARLQARANAARVTVDIKRPVARLLEQLDN
jgi:hypothetical protein